MSLLTLTRTHVKERRRCPRQQVEARGELLVCPASIKTGPIEVIVRDVSATGVGVRHDSPLPLGQKCVVKAPGLDENKACLYTVVRAERTGDGAFDIGLHASHLMDDSGFYPRESHDRGHIGAMAKLLILTLLFGILGAVAVSMY
jgi:hypothetical protein